LISQKRFAFVDGLSGLYLPDTEKIPDKAGEHTLRSPDLSKVSSTIQTACQSLQSSPSSSDKVLLILDSLDLLLATQEGTLTPQDLSDTLLDLRTQTHATVLTLTASSPLILRQSTPLEVNHAALTLSIAHQADLILALRLLDTGTAKDVSGVVRITEREGWDRREGREGNGEGLREGGKELLYYVGQDGGARVFERGQ
jgi:elongator complex protein 6